MGIIERLQQLDDRLGLDSASKRDRAESRRTALEALPDDVRASMTRRRVMAVVLTTVAAIAVGLTIGWLVSFKRPVMTIVMVLLIFAATMASHLVSKRSEDAALDAHGWTAHDRD